MSLEALGDPAVAQRLIEFVSAYPEHLKEVAGFAAGYKMAATNGEALLKKDWKAEGIVAFIHQQADKVQSFLDLAAREHDREQEKKHGR